MYLPRINPAMPLLLSGRVFCRCCEPHDQREMLKKAPVLIFRVRVMMINLVMPLLLARRVFCRCREPQTNRLVPRNRVPELVLLPIQMITVSLICSQVRSIVAQLSVGSLTVTAGSSRVMVPILQNVVRIVGIPEPARLDTRLNVISVG